MAIRAPDGAKNQIPQLAFRKNSIFAENGDPWAGGRGLLPPQRTDSLEMMVIVEIAVLMMIVMISEQLVIWIMIMKMMMIKMMMMRLIVRKCK